MLMARMTDHSIQKNNFSATRILYYNTHQIQYHAKLHTLYWKTNRNPMNALKYFSKSGSFYSTFTYIMAIRN